MERDNMTGPNRPDRWRIDMTEQEQLRQLKEEYENMIIPETGRERIMSDNGQADNKSDETIPAPKTDDSTSKYAWNNTIIIIIGICIILIVFGAVFYVRKKSGSEEE